MVSISKKQGIVGGAILIALILVGGAYAFTNNLFPSGPTPLSAESTDEILKEYAARDTDTDGLPDWQEALYGTDPENPHSVRPDVTDAEAVEQKLVTPAPAPAEGSVAGDIIASIPGETPAKGSVTEKFALSFFETYIDTGVTTTLTDDALRTFVTGALEELKKSEVRGDVYGSGSLAPSGNATFASYAAGAERVFTENALETKYDELTYFSDAVLKQDAAALLKVKQSGEHYAAIAKDLIAVPAPSALAPAHLSLANATARLGATILDMAALKDDPVRSTLGFGNYETDVRAFAEALAGVKKAYDAGGASVPASADGGSFFALISQVAAALTKSP